MTIASVEQSNNMRRARTVALWMAATVFSLALNVALFDLMPSLIDGNPDKSEHAQYMEKVNIIRIKRSEQQVRRKEKKRKIRPKEQIKELIREKQVYANRAKKRLVDLPFEINPKLTAISGTLKVSPMEMVRLDLPGLNGSYGIGEIDHPLIPIAQVPPMYPMLARRRGIEGWVRVRFIVNENGRVSDIKIIESRPEKVFNNAVLRCVSAWRFTPGTVEGEPVKTWVVTTVRFELE